MAAVLLNSTSVSHTVAQSVARNVQSTTIASVAHAAAHAVEEEDDINVIDKLQSQGVNVSDIQKLKAGGYCTVLSIIQATKRELCNLKGLSEAKVEKIVEAARSIESATSFITGNEFLLKRANVLKVSTGCQAFDTILQGGIESMAITEMFGEARTGKTQLCHTLCVTAQLPIEMNGGNGKVCYIDSEGTFRPEKISRIAERFGLSGEAVLDNIMYARAYTSEHQYELLKVAAARMIDDRFSLLIMDSIMSLFRVDFSGRGELSERQQMLGKMLSRLQKMSEQFNIAVVITNHVMSDPAAGLTFVPNPSKPVGGHVLGHASTHRLSLRKGKGDQRVVKVYDSPSMAEGECVFSIADNGVVDAVD
eukprot:GDKJ01058513.1.p1 GENE.GDKJ01058513.1~~GDKJ01058513.1.p1  ORF type:complete len:364 (+),score=73.53 GDKJ01058513.1:55-1146(+)